MKRIYFFIAIAFFGCNIYAHQKMTSSQIILKAIAKKDKEALDYLLKNNRELSDIINECGYTLAHYAVLQEFADGLYLILSYNSNIINKADNLGCTPLHLSVCKSDIACIRLLLNHNANVNIQDKFGCTPFHWACLGKNKKIIDMFLKYKPNIALKNNAGILPLAYLDKSNSLLRAKF